MKPLPFLPSRLVHQERPGKRTNIRSPHARKMQILLVLYFCSVPCSNLIAHGGDSAGHVAAECTVRLFIRTKTRSTRSPGWQNALSVSATCSLRMCRMRICQTNLTALSPVSSDLFQAATEIKCIQSRLQPIEQTRVLQALALFVKACAVSAPAQHQKYFDYSRFDFCGFQDEWQSIKADSAYTVAFVSPEPLLGLMGIFGFVGDALTFLPNVVARQARDLRRRRARKQSVKAARDFIQLVSVYKRQHGDVDQSAK